MFWTKKDLKPNDDINICVVSSGSDIQAYEEAKMMLDGVRRGQEVGSTIYMLASFVLRWYPVIEGLKPVIAGIKKNIAYDAEAEKAKGEKP
jgi:hypothetical protein